MNNTKSLTYENINANLIIVTETKEDNETFFYIAEKSEISMLDEGEDFDPIAKGKSKEECLTKAINSVYVSGLNLKKEVKDFIGKINWRGTDDFDFSKEIILEHPDDCRFDNFYIENEEISFMNCFDNDPPTTI